MHRWQALRILEAGQVENAGPGRNITRWLLGHNYINFNRASQPYHFWSQRYHITEMGRAYLLLQDDTATGLTEGSER